jgi:hypothetical protein
VIREKVSALRVIRQLDAVKPIIRKRGSDLLEIENLLLACVQFVIGNSLSKRLLTFPFSGHFCVFLALSAS